MNGDLSLNLPHPARHFWLPVLIVFLLLITGCQSTGEKFGEAVGAAGGTTLSIIFRDSTAAQVGFRVGGQIGKSIGSLVGKYQDEYSVENPDIVSSSN